MGESGRSLGLLGGGGLFVMSCVDCVAGFVCCVVVLVGEEGWLFGGIFLCSIVCLCVGCLVGGLASRVL